MKMTFKLPLPDHHPKVAFEFLTGYGHVEHVDPMLGEFTYSLEGEMLGALVQRLHEVSQEANCYDWWDGRFDLFEQAQEQIDAQKLGIIELSQATVKALESHFKKVKGAGTGITVTRTEKLLATDVLALLKKFKPMQIEERS